jgi:hypothetical protein
MELARHFGLIIGTNHDDEFGFFANFTTAIVRVSNQVRKKDQNPHTPCSAEHWRAKN